MPRFQIEGASDAYTYYVLISGVPEDVFWHAQHAFLIEVVGDYAAYNEWVNYEKKKAIESARRRR